MSVIRGYRGALDGVRALAIAGVIAEHAHLRSALPAGSLGVDVFFVLSGYLITGLLVAERHDTGTMHLPEFYLRRVARLYPALLALIVLGGLIRVVDLNQPGHKVVVGGVIAGTYLTDIATFTGITSWAVWGQTWSLAIEEHFYLLWPFALRLIQRRGLAFCRNVAFAAAGLGLVMTEAFARNGGAGGGPAATYFQPQTHAGGLLLGCGIALLPTLPGWIRHAAAPSLLGIVALMVTLPNAAHASYIRAGVPATWLLTAALLLALEHRTLVTPVLEWSPIRRIGVISYGIYLFHQLVFQLVDAHLHRSRPVVIVVGIALSLVVAELSYRFYERPIRSASRRFSARRGSSLPETSGQH